MTAKEINGMICLQFFLKLFFNLLETAIAAKAGLAGVALLFSAVLTVWAWPVS